jgi:hypothetical protein
MSDDEDKWLPGLSWAILIAIFLAAFFGSMMVMK